MIQYQYCSGNSPKDERNDCTVRALAIATDSKYYDAYKLLYNAGRKPNKGFHIERLLRSSCFYLGCQFVKLKFRKSITLNRFIKKYPAGIFYVKKRGHVFVVKDGIVLDMFKNGPYTKVIAAWRVESVF
jgi:hypothetical protein